MPVYRKKLGFSISLTPEAHIARHGEVRKLAKMTAKTAEATPVRGIADYFAAVSIKQRVDG